MRYVVGDNEQKIVRQKLHPCVSYAGAFVIGENVRPKLLNGYKLRRQ